MLLYLLKTHSVGHTPQKNSVGRVCLCDTINLKITEGYWEWEQIGREKTYTHLRHSYYTIVRILI